MPLLIMRIISRKKLKDFWIHHPQAKRPLRAWYADAKQASWIPPTSIKNVYRNASIFGDNRVVFNIKGNDYRLIVAVNYHCAVVYIRFIGSHVEYDQVNAETI